MRAIVLAGGGSKGAYQIGVWKALRKLHISYDIVTGTSVGALNAALMVQKDYLKALSLWNNLDSSMVYGESVDIKENKDFVKYAKDIITDGGLDVKNLEKTVEKYINIKKIYSSKVDMGIVTVKFPTLKPIELTKNKIKPEKLKDYLLASASCFPAFPVKKIDGEEFIDGGIYDNLPINLAISMGATEVIAVDLEAIGIKQKVKNKNIPIKIISPSGSTGSFLVFDKNSARRAIKLGYNDTMRSFGKFDGDLFSFKKNHLRLNYNKYRNKFIDQFHKLLNLDDQSFISKIAHLSIFESIYNSHNEENFYNKFNFIFEKVGETFELDKTLLYSFNKYNNKLIERVNMISKESFEEIYSKRHSARLKRIFNDDLMVAYIYNYLKYNDNISDISNIVLLFPNAFLMALYLKVIK